MSYPAATLNYLASKKRWYVYVTIPPELRPAFNGDKQVRRSTGTADEREAKRRLHDMATGIYELFDRHKPIPKLDWAKGVESNFRFIGGEGVNWQGLAANPPSIDEVVAILKAHLEAIQSLPSDPQSAEVVDAHLERLAALEAINPNPASLFKSVADDFMKDEKFTRQQIKKAYQLALTEFSDFVADKPFAEIKPPTIYSYADYLAKDKGFSTTTISGRVAKLQSVFNYAVRKGYIDSNPAHGLRISGYGKAKESYLPFTKDELSQIFKLDLPQRERLLFSIIVTTGMRLDEAALLSWENIKTEDGINYFDLTSEGYLVKNKGSARKVPVHPSLKLPERGAGRLFDYKLNSDGKTTTASERCNKQVRRVTTDSRKVVHSFRHTIKDLFRDAGVSKEVQDFLTGHASGDVAGKYGSGPSMKTRYEAICLIDHPWLA
jgi:integrase